MEGTHLKIEWEIVALMCVCVCATDAMCATDATCVTSGHIHIRISSTFYKPRAYTHVVSFHFHSYHEVRLCDMCQSPIIQGLLYRYS